MEIYLKSNLQIYQYMLNNEKTLHNNVYNALGDK